jgi:Ca2+-binding EF-hand superfamily protein
MRKIFATSIAAIAIAGTTVAFAQPAPPAPPGVQATSPYMPLPPERPVRPMPVKKMAHPQTRADVQAHVQRMFARLDTNHDGFVTKAEAEAAHGKMMGDMHTRMEKRFAEGGHPRPDRGAMFDRLDTNHDGMISRQEYLAGKPEIREHRVMVMRNSDGPMPMGPGSVHGMHGMRMGMMGGRLFDLADANHDGRVTLQEMTAAALQHFDMADANHDGTITPEERMQMHQRMRMQHKPG